MSSFILLTVVFGALVQNALSLDASYDLFDVANLPGIVYNAGQNPSPLTFGAMVAAAGDFNGDDIADFITSGPAAASGAGIVYVIFGADDLSGITVADFVDGPTTGFRIYGIYNTDGIGTSIGGGADLNGDGFDEILIGAVRDHLYVIFGHDGTSRDITSLHLADWTSDMGFRITFEPAFGQSNYGNAVSYAGDVNNDGQDDIVIGGQFITIYNGIFYGGSAYVLFGRSAAAAAIKPFEDDMILTPYPTDLTLGFLIKGHTAWKHFGSSVAAAGDVNNDGYDDVLVGCSELDSNGLTGNGMVYVIFGYDTSSSNPHDIDIASPPSGYGFQIAGAQSGVNLPSSMAGIGDTNGDGVDDFAVAVTRHTVNDVGAVYVIYGDPNLGADMNLTDFSTGSDGYLFLGVTAGGDLGISLAGAGDVNHDGRDDYIVGATGENIASAGGSAFVVYGTATSRTTDLLVTAINNGGPDGTIFYGAANTNAGKTVGGIGDVNNDGGNDLFISTKYGNSFVVFGNAPSRKPSANPTASPTYLQSIFQSSSYKVRNGFAFAVTAADGSAYAWGEVPYGGDPTAVSAQLSTGVTEIVPTRFAFAAVNSAQQSASFWGVGVSGTATAIHGVVANENAFAGVTSTGAVAAFGSKYTGGDVSSDAHCNGFSTQLSSGVASVVASAGAFAALMLNGHVYAWGSVHNGAGVSTETLTQLTNVVQVVATREAFAARTTSGRVLTWGSALAGGDSSAISSALSGGVFHLVATRSAFAAYKMGYYLVVWGYGKYGGDASAVQGSLSANVAGVFHTFTAMAALKADGTVVTWGMPGDGGDSSAVQADLHAVEHIYANSKAFAALTSTGRVVAWGRAAYGGQIPADKVNALSSGVVSIQHTDRAFAALKADKTVVVWGQAGHGGSPGATVQNLLTTVHTICANDVAFSAIRDDGKVVAWGHEVSVPAPGVQFTSSSLMQIATCAE